MSHECALCTEASLRQWSLLKQIVVYNSLKEIKKYNSHITINGLIWGFQVGTF